MTNYLWNGRPVAYLDPDPLNTGFNVYGFDGTHLGWYDGGGLGSRGWWQLCDQRAHAVSRA